MALVPLGTQVRPYRDYLTPALHRRFNKASLYTFLLCYAIALWMGEWTQPLWFWFPFGPTGIRASLLFIPALTVYVLRVAQWHVGRRHTTTQAETFRRYALRRSNILTLVFYIFSAWIYSEVFIWSRNVEDKLGFTELGREYERIKLNERPFYLRYLFVALAIAQSGVHIFRDYDKIEVAALKPKKEREDKTDGAPIRRGLRPREVLVKRFLPMLQGSISLTAATFVLGSFIYFVGLRNLIWDYYYSLSRNLWSLSKTSRPTGVAPFVPLVWNFAAQGTLLVLLWKFVNKAFDLYIAQEPLKNDKPITDDSKDSNGTLLNGLKSKKDAVKAIAFWELAIITDAFADRRATIYNEVGRKKAETFQQVTTVCLAEIKYLIDRLSLGLDPSYHPTTVTDKPQSSETLTLVPRVSQPLKDDKQITAPPEAPEATWGKIESGTRDFAKKFSASENSQQAYGRQMIKQGVKKAHESAQQVEQSATSNWQSLVSSPFGGVFRQSFQRAASIVVLGSPYSRFSLICNAITALSNLAVFSLSQDSLGRFHEGIPEIVRVFTTAITKLDAYMASAPIHASDHETLKKPESEQRKVPEIEEVRECLRVGLEKILGSFNEYLSGMGLSQLEIVDAKKAMSGAKKPEMIQTSSS